MSNTNYTGKTPQDKVKECTKHNRCGLFRLCEPCSRIRQAKLCDITELASRFSNKATYAVIMPYSKAQNPKTIQQLKTKLTRKIRKQSDGLTVSVETTANDALHLNLLINSNEAIPIKTYQDVLISSNVQADLFNEEISKNDIRKVSAYAIKKQAIPTYEQYQGNTLNLSGTVRTCKEIMQNKKMIYYNPTIAITSMNNTLKDLGLQPMDEKITEHWSVRASLTNLIHMINQIKGLGICYSNTQGIITTNQFKTLYTNKYQEWKGKILGK